MSSERPTEASVFNAARQIQSVDERNAFLKDACGDDTALRERVDKLLAAFIEESQFLEQPAPGLEKTVVPDPGGKNLAASLNAGLAATFGEESAVVVGNTNHSVLKSMSASLTEVPRVSLREPKQEGEEPIQRPSSPEIPNQPSDSRYRLDGEIARGGMGAVLRGRDTDLGRDLAVKVLLEAHKDKPEVVQRFIEEAQIGGQLQHPGIAPVYELGQFADQRPFFSMKLVKGDTLSKLLLDREDPTADRSKLIGIFEQVCQTMAYAHSRGVIHRDLKPANIMVGAFGEVQVMDWGLAKVLPVGGVADEKTARRKQNGETMIQTMRSVGSDVPGSIGSSGSETQAGSVMGTPAYMPPEQALGEIDMLDQRADVFGLGAILAEILTGQPPYVADNGTQIYRMASRGKLGEAFTRLDGCAADPELITLAKHCLEVEPADRPQDAGVLADRITAYLESVEQKLRETELAKVDALVRAEELRRRQRLAYMTGTAIVATLLLGISVSLWQMNRAIKAETLARNEADRATMADLARNEADEARRRAEAAETLARSEAEQLTKKELENYQLFVTDIDNLLRTQPGMSDLRIKVLDSVSEKLDEIDAGLAGGIRGEAIPTLMATRYRLSTAFRELNQLESADTESKRLLELVRERIALNAGNDSRRTNLAKVLIWSSALARRQGDPQRGVKMLEEAIAVLEEVLEDPQPEEGGPSENEIIGTLGNAQQTLGVEHLHDGKMAQAELAFSKALDAGERVLANIREEDGYDELDDNQKDSKTASKQMLLDRSRLALAYIRLRLGKTAEAIPLYDSAIKSRREVFDRRPQMLIMKNELASHLQTYGRSLVWLRRLPEATPLLREALKLAREVVDAEPETGEG